MTTKINLCVRADNDRAIRLHLKMGFVCEGTISRGLRSEDEDFDNGLMGREL